MPAMRAVDQHIVALVAKIEDQQQFQDRLLEAAGKEGRDLTENELELFERSRNEMQDLNKQLGPAKESRAISSESQSMLAEISRFWKAEKPETPEVEYRSAGQYALDMWRAGLGEQDARDRLEKYNLRAAAHQTTSDNPGLLPAPIVGGVVNFIDATRPVVSAIGPQQIPGTGFSRPKVTQHTAVAAQSAEKAELTSQKMTITKTPVTPVTYGGYVNVSRQDIDWTQPAVMDIVIGDLAAQYAIKTEQVAVQAFYSGATAGTVTIPASPTADNVAAAFWGAAGQVFTATKGQGRLIAAASPDVLGIVGPLFAPVNPVDAQSQGFNAVNYGTGAMGSVGGIPVYVTSGFAAAKSLMILSTAAAEVYEDRIGSLSVVEPSVLGVQVAYAGYFVPLLIEATGIIKVTVT